MHELLRATRQYLSEERQFETKSSAENETRLLRITRVSQNACGSQHKRKSANASQLLRRIPTSGTRLIQKVSTVSL